jgi:glycosyltransferase involved in cell wall biosynthesis
MAYAIVDLELTAPLPDLALGEHENGLFLLLRARGRPVHYGMHALHPGARLDPVELAHLIGRAPIHALLEEAVRAELCPLVAARPVDLTVAICTRARADLLASCLRSVLALRPDDPADPRHFEVLVVDNDPPDDATERLVATLSGVRYAREPRPGLDFARNRALTEGTGTWTAFLDDDVTVDRWWLEGLEEAVAEHPDAASVTGLVLPYELATDPQIIFERRGGFGRGCRKRCFAGPAGPDNPLFPLGAGIIGAGCNMVLRTDAVRAAGGFDEALDTGPPLPGGGDLDIWSRLARAGHPLVYEPRLLVFHRHRPDHVSLRRQYWSWGEAFMAYLTKTARVDAAQRRRTAHLVGWWLGYETRNVAASVRPGNELPSDLPLAELVGGLVGLAGSYGRSRRRVARIRATHG